MYAGVVVSGADGRQVQTVDAMCNGTGQHQTPVWLLSPCAQLPISCVIMSTSCNRSAQKRTYSQHERTYVHTRCTPGWHDVAGSARMMAEFSWLCVIESCALRIGQTYTTDRGVLNVAIRAQDQSPRKSSIDWSHRVLSIPTRSDIWYLNEESCVICTTDVSPSSARDAI